MDEKRRFSRVPFSITAQIDGAERRFKADVSNLSLRGAFIHGGEAIPAGQALSLTLELIGDSSDLTVTVSGRVIRASADGIGIEFEHMDLDSFIHLRNIVAYNSGDADKIDREFRDFVKQRGAALSG